MSTQRPPSRSEWHLDRDDLADYVSGPAATGPVLAASIEAHLLGCAQCRSRLAGLDHAARDHAWQRLADEIDRPTPSVLGRLTGGNRLARSAIATPTMARAALVAVALVVVVPLAAALASGGALPLMVLVIAPLVPVGSVALAYRHWSDPAGEITLATPSAGMRLVAMRALVVSLGSLALGVTALLLARVWTDVPLALAFAWCLPGLALAALVLLAGTTTMDPLPVAVGLGVSWAGALLAGASLRRSLRHELLLEVVVSPGFQAAALLLSLSAVALTVVRRDALSYRRTT